MINFRYFIPTKILFGTNSLERFHKENLPGKKALIVLSTGKSAIESGALGRLKKQLELNGTEYALYQGITANPTRQEVMNGLEIYRKNSCDFIIALGGGSCIDAAKALAIVATNGGDLWDYFHGGSAKGKQVKIQMAPVIAIPTTAGTGSEVDQWMVISDKDKNEKIGFGYSKSFPTTAIVDPSIMITLPAMLTAYQGIDALFHATEGYLSSEANPISDALAEKAIALINGSLANVVNNGEDIIKREEMAAASTLSGMVLALTSMTGEHALGEGLSGFYSDLPHGVGLILISLEYYTLIYNLGHSEERLIKMATLMGVENPKTGLDFVERLRLLYEECGISEIKMSDYGIEKENFEKIVDIAMAHAASEFRAEKTPLTKEQCVNLLNKSYR
ncbi:MAG: iron-containing alcohol dehydrogenase [Anaerovoracaceae bacterium]|nr:iron-containing alcohol dehydrogenase [Anaerovoracaceae bacterium]